MPFIDKLVIVVCGRRKLFREDCEHKRREEKERKKKKAPSEGRNNEMLKRREGIHEVNT